MVNKIRNNTVSKIPAKTSLNALNKIKKKKITKKQHQQRTFKQNELLNLFNNLSDIILTDKTLESESKENENENEKVESRKEENEDDDYKNKDEYKNEDDNYKNENEDDDETMSQNEKTK